MDDQDDAERAEIEAELGRFRVDLDERDRVIRNLIARKKRTRIIAEVLGLSRQHVNDIWHGRRTRKTAAK